MFDVSGFPGFDDVYIPAAWCTYATGDTLCAACATLVDVIHDVQIVVITNNIADLSTYDTNIYDLSNEPFIVTCTPTSQDFSGVMDKTVAEINEAYEAGRKIYFRVLTGASTYAEVSCTIAVKDTALYPSYGGYTIDIRNNLFIYVWTGYTNDGTIDTYATTVFPLTPMS